MVALFVVLTIVFFLTIDLVLAARQQAGLAGTVARQRAASASPAETVGGFVLAPDRAYHPGHTWARFQPDAVTRIGLDDFAARLLGAPAEVELPEVGRHVRAGEALVVLGRNGRRAALVSPVSGVVTGINRRVREHAATATRDPYGEGWLVEVKAKEFRTDARRLASGDAARQWLDQAVTDLHGVFAPAGSMAAAADGGRPVDALADQLDDATFRQVRTRFLLADPD